MLASMFSRSRVDRAKRSSRVTMTTVAGADGAEKPGSSTRSVLAPLASPGRSCLAGAGRLQGVQLGVERLPIRRDPRVAVDCA